MGTLVAPGRKARRKGNWLEVVLYLAEVWARAILIIIVNVPSIVNPFTGED